MPDMGGAAYGCTAYMAQVVGRRAEQQDAVDMISTGMGTLLILADGMGGMKRGALLARTAVHAVKEAFLRMRAMQPDHCLLHLCAAAQQSVLEAQEDENEGGCTLVLALLTGGGLWFLSVGDSRLYLVRRGAALQLTRDQCYGAVLDERAAQGRISMQDAQESGMRDSLSNYIGYTRFRDPDRNTRALALLPGDCVALVSDGVYRALDEARLAALLGGGGDQTARVLDAVMARNIERQDNASIVTACVQRR